MTDAGLRALGGLGGGPVRLTVADAPAVTGAGVFSLKRLRGLKFVRCGLTDDGLAAVAVLPDLRELMVSAPTGGGLTDAVWERLSWSRSLFDLNFEDAPVGGPGLAAVRFLSPPHDAPQRVQLILKRVGLTDAILRGLPPLPDVRELSLAGDPITADRVLAFLANQPQIEELSVSDCPAATGDGPARIAAALERR